MKRTLQVHIVDADGVSHAVTVEGMSRDKWAALVDKHPPRRDGEDRLWNGVTFPPALIAACTGIPRSQAETWWRDAANDSAYDVYEACLRVASPGSVDWAIERLRTNGRTFSEVKAATRLGVSRTDFLKMPADDQDFVIAMLALEGDTCPGGCGVSRSEMSNPVAYQTAKSTCIWCRQLDLARDEVQPEARSYTHITLVPKKGR